MFLILWTTWWKTGLAVQRTSLCPWEFTRSGIKTSIQIANKCSVDIFSTPSMLTSTFPWFLTKLVSNLQWSPCWFDPTSTDHHLPKMHSCIHLIIWSYKRAIYGMCLWTFPSRRESRQINFYTKHGWRQPISENQLGAIQALWPSRSWWSTWPEIHHFEEACQTSKREVCKLQDVFSHW